MIYTLVAVSAVVPSLLLMWYFHRRDVFREPARDLWIVFGGGVLIVLPVLAVARPIDPWIDAIDPPLLYGLASAFFQAAIPEELFKLVVLWLALRLAAFDEPMDGVVYGVAASLGFATLENVVYVANGGAAVALTRALTAVPSHAFLGVIMGFFVGRARFDDERRSVLMALGLAVPVVLHGLYDWPLLAAARVTQLDGDPSGATEPLIMALISIAPIVVVGEWICALRMTRRLRLEQLGRLPESERPPMPTRVERWSTLALTLAGAVVASLGGLLFLGGSWIALAERIDGGPIAGPLALLVLLGLTPAVIGVALFLWGVRRLNDPTGVPGDRRRRQLASRPHGG